MKHLPTVIVTLSRVLFLIGVAGLILPSLLFANQSPAETGEAGHSRGRGEENRSDPCEHLPDAPGEAKGHDKKCPQKGSSGGVARGDFNGDNFADLAVGVPLEDAGNLVNAGLVHIIYGSADGLTATAGTNRPAPQVWHQNTSGVLDAAEASDQFGAALAAGNFNGDDFSDLAIGVPGESGDYTGAVNVLYGSPSGLTSVDDQFWRLADFFPDSAPEFPAASTQLGASLVWGNFNGDEFGDLAIGIPGAGNVCGIFCEHRNSGRVGILYGSAEGLSAVGAQQLMQSGRGGFDVQVGDALEGNDKFGEALSAGDFDADGADDLVVGVPSEDAQQPNAGLVHIVYGSEDGFSSSRTGAFGCSPEGRCGDALAVGNFDGDGFADLAIGAPFTDAGGDQSSGAVFVYYGGGQGLTSAGFQLWTQDTDGIAGLTERDDFFGWALAAGDFDADGASDLAIGVPEEDSVDAAGVVQANAGAVHIIYGTTDGLDAAGDQFFHQGNLGAGQTLEGDDRFGESLTAWNFGRNQFVNTPPFSRTVFSADLAIGVPREDFFINPQLDRIENGGAVSVLYGRFLSGLSAEGKQLWHQTIPGVTTPGDAGDTMEAGDHFGQALY